MAPSLLEPAVARQRNGGRVVHPAMAVVQSAALVGIAAGVAAADAALSAGQVTRKDLEVALRVARLGPGRADARAAVELADGLAESPGESWARVLFVSLGLPKVEPQKEIRDAAGRFVARVDFLFRSTERLSSSTAWSSMAVREVVRRSSTRSVARTRCARSATKWFA